MKRLVYRKRSFVRSPTDMPAEGTSAHPAATSSGTQSVEDVLRERIQFVYGPSPVQSRQATVIDGAADRRGEKSTFDIDVSTLSSAHLYHGLIDSEEKVDEALRILEEFETRGAIEEYVVESDVKPPPPIPDSPLAGRKPWPFESLFRKNFTARQTYLENAPTGIGARHAWSFRGGRGNGVTLVDVELGFHRAHEDLRRAAHTSPGVPDHSHGTMSLGVCCADENTIGIIGIAPGARPELESVRNDDALMSDYPLASVAIRKCVDRLHEGDVILLELEAKYLYSRLDRSGYFSRTLPIERSPDVADAIATAERKNIYVVEAAGNGGLDLCTAGLNKWTGAILVGAGDPDTRTWVYGTNYGERVDVHGWGLKVVSTASSWEDATLSKGVGKEWRSRSYTQNFDGTSSAAAMVAGIVACLSGIMQANGFGILTPIEMRNLLVQTGRLFTGNKKIGPMPDLEAAIAKLRAEHGPLDLAA